MQSMVTGFTLKLLKYSMSKCYKGFNKSSVELYSGVCYSNINEIINEGFHRA